MKNSKYRRLGILTAGGDCPGLNAVIRAATKTAILDYGMEVIGFEDGYEGLVNNIFHPLHYNNVSGILSEGGTILGTSNTANPWRWPQEDSDGNIDFIDLSAKAISNFRKLGLDCLISIGGDGTMHISQKFVDAGLPIIGVPKTIDNDLAATDYTFGFHTAVQTATEAIDRIHSTAESHHRVMIIELMGRYAGWLTLYSGVASGSDIILIPEIPYSLQKVAEVCESRGRKGKRFTIIAIAEGACEEGGDLFIREKVEKSTDPIRLGGVGQKLAADLGDLINIECRVTILGHLQRGGSPCPYDRLLATRFGVLATELAAQGKFGNMVCLRGTEVTYVTISEAIRSLKKVTPDHPLISAARSIGTSFGSQDD